METSYPEPSAALAHAEPVPHQSAFQGNPPAKRKAPFQSDHNLRACGAIIHDKGYGPHKRNCTICKLETDNQPNILTLLAEITALREEVKASNMKLAKLERLVAQLNVKANVFVPQAAFSPQAGALNPFFQPRAPNPLQPQQQPQQEPQPQPAPNQINPKTPNPEKELIADGIPYTHDEKTEDIVMAIARAKGVPLTHQDFTCFRALKKHDQEKKNEAALAPRRPPKIIIKLITNTLKTDLKKKSSLALTEIGFRECGTDRAFFSENLTPSQRELFFQTRKANKTRLQYKYVWTRDGNIYVKAKDNTAKIQIRSEDDLQALRPERDE
jgi:hypothetical protein